MSDEIDWEQRYKAELRLRRRAEKKTATANTAVEEWSRKSRAFENRLASALASNKIMAMYQTSAAANNAKMGLILAIINGEIGPENMRLE